MNKLKRQSTSSGTPIISDIKLLVNISKISIGQHCLLQPKVQIRGDLAAVNIGHHTIIEENCIIEPPGQNLLDQSKYVSINIGNYVHIENGCVVRSIDIGSHVFIGKNCVLDPMSKISDMCYICENTVVPYRMVVPPQSCVQGNPAIVVSVLPEFFSYKIMKSNEEIYKLRAETSR